jgi:hypothetical protein
MEMGFEIQLAGLDALNFLGSIWGHAGELALNTNILRLNVSKLTAEPRRSQSLSG